jgi:WD40 repeat protein
MAAGRRITALALTPDGSAVIAADRLGHLRMWSLPGRELLWSRDGLPTSWLAVSPDGRRLATVGNTYEGGVPDGDSVSSTFSVWDLGTREIELSEDLTAEQFEPQVVHQRWQSQPTPRAVTFSPDSTKVAIAYLDGYLMVYDVVQRRRTSALLTRQTAPSSMTFSPDSTRLLTTSPDYVDVWDANTGEKLRRTFVPGVRDFTGMTYTDDDRWLAISHPRSVTVLDAQTFRVAAADLRLPTDRPTDAIAVAAGQNDRLIVGTRTVLASIDMDPERWKSKACEVAGRTMTKDEWSSFLPSIPFAPACG